MQFSQRVFRYYSSSGKLPATAVGRRFKGERKPYSAESFYHKGNTVNRVILPGAARRLLKIKELFGGRESIARAVLAEIERHPSLAMPDLRIKISKELSSKGFKVYSPPIAGSKGIGRSILITPGLVERIVLLLETKGVVKNLNAKRNPVQKSRRK